MAVLHSAELWHARELGRRTDDHAGLQVRFEAESVSFTSAAGQNVSSRPSAGVPAGEVWEVFGLYAINNEAQANKVHFVTIDPDGLRYVSVPDGPIPSIPAGEEVGWSGRLYLPAGWKIGVRFPAMAGGVAGNAWRFTALAIAHG
ncbi:MAG: hypothetical protein M3O70_21600 [Actinomycetota bacterium]|nr:hypothetical protein [Actinomycetota bacterium]